MIKCTHLTTYSKFTHDASKNKQKFCYCQSKNFSGTSDTVRQLKTFKIILMKCQFYFLSYVDDILVVYRCIYFHEQIFFQIFVPRGNTCQFFLEIIAYEQYRF